MTAQHLAEQGEWESPDNRPFSLWDEAARQPAAQTTSSLLSSSLFPPLIASPVPALIRQQPSLLHLVSETPSRQSTLLLPLVIRYTFTRLTPLSSYTPSLATDSTRLDSTTLCQRFSLYAYNLSCLRLRPPLFLFVAALSTPLSNNSSLFRLSRSLIRSFPYDSVFATVPRHFRRGALPATVYVSSVIS